MGYDRNCLCCPTHCCDFADIYIQMSVEVIGFSNFQSILVTGVAKVMFLHVSVILSTGGGLHTERTHSPDQAGRPPGRETLRDQGDPPAGRHPPDQADPPGKQTSAYGQRAAGTHPTGMHSCNGL